MDQPPQGDEWLHEIKHDGYRTLVVVDSGDARAYTRTGLDWTKRYPGIVNAAAKLKCRSAIFDGEVIVQDERGVSDFDAPMSAIDCQTPLTFGGAVELWSWRLRYAAVGTSCAPKTNSPKSIRLRHQPRGFLEPSFW